MADLQQFGLALATFMSLLEFREAHMYWLADEACRRATRAEPFQRERLP